MLLHARDRVLDEQRPSGDSPGGTPLTTEPTSDEWSDGPRRVSGASSGAAAASDAYCNSPRCSDARDVERICVMRRLKRFSDTPVAPAR